MRKVEGLVPKWVPGFETTQNVAENPSPRIIIWKMKNPLLESLIDKLYEKSRKENMPLWRRIAKELGRATRQKRVVNLHKLSRYTKPKEWVIVPGKVLGNGKLQHELNVIAYQFSKKALEAINEKGKAFTIEEFILESIKAKGIRIIC